MTVCQSPHRRQIFSQLRWTLQWIATLATDNCVCLIEKSNTQTRELVPHHKVSINPDSLFSDTFNVLSLLLFLLSTQSSSMLDGTAAHMHLTLLFVKWTLRRAIMTKIFYKKIFETTLLVCSSCVIFSGTVSAVLLMLAWPNDRILGLSTRLVITVSATPVAATLAQTHLLFLDRHVKTFSMSGHLYTKYFKIRTATFDCTITLVSSCCAHRSSQMKANTKKDKII